MFASRRGIFTIYSDLNGWNPPMAQRFRSFWERILRCHPVTTRHSPTTKTALPPESKRRLPCVSCTFQRRMGRGGWMFWGLQSKPNDNDGLEQVTPFKHGNLLVSMLHFLGCISVFWCICQPCQFFKNL